MRNTSLYSVWVAAALAISVSAFSPVQAETPAVPGKVAVSPRLKEFEKLLHETAAELVKVMEPDAGGMIRPGKAVAIIKKCGQADTSALTVELAAAYLSFTDHLAKVGAVLAELPAELKMTPEGMKALAEKDPAAAEKVKGLPARLESLDEEGLILSWKLEKAAAASGINLLPFLDPDFSGKTSPTPAAGQTSPKKFAAAIDGLPDKQNALREKLRGKLLLMGDVAKLINAEAGLLYAIPVDGLPDEVAASFSRVRRSTVKHGWAVEELPADMAAADVKAVNEYIANRKKTEPDFEKTILQITRRVGTVKKKREDHNEHFRKACAAAKIDIGAFMQITPPPPAKGEASGAKEKAPQPKGKPAKGK